jgi:hypothetical protein
VRKYNHSQVNGTKRYNPRFAQTDLIWGQSSGAPALQNLAILLGGTLEVPAVGALELSTNRSMSAKLMQLPSLALLQCYAMTCKGLSAVSAAALPASRYRVLPHSNVLLRLQTIVTKSLSAAL